MHMILHYESEIIYICHSLKKNPAVFKQHNPAT